MLVPGGLDGRWGCAWRCQGDGAPSPGGGAAGRALPAPRRAEPTRGAPPARLRDPTRVPPPREKAAPVYPAARARGEGAAPLGLRLAPIGHGATGVRGQGRYWRQLPVSQPGGEGGASSGGSLPRGAFKDAGRHFGSVSWPLLAGALLLCAHACAYGGRKVGFVRLVELMQGSLPALLPARSDGSCEVAAP